MMIDRVKVDDLGSVVAEVASALGIRLREKGNLSFASNHEALGIITEEYYELVEAVCSNDFEDIRSEMIDIAVGCLFGVASMDAKLLSPAKK